VIARTEKTRPESRLNPFAFPSDTDFRFVMLITATISASLVIYNFLYDAFPANRTISSTNIISCLHAASIAHPGNSFNNQAAFANFYGQCIAPYNSTLAAWIGLGVALLLSIAAAIYWMLPASKIRRDGLRQLEISNTPPGMMAYLEELCRQAELRRSPIFLLNPYSSAASGVAFGRLGCYYVVLHAGLIKLFQDDRPFFRAVVLHELAHMRNGDINKTYFTISIVWSFLLTALLPWIVSQFINQFSYQSILNVFTLGWPVLILTVLIYLIRNALLRARELYADVRASTWDGSEGALGRVLGTLSHPKEGRLRRILRARPDPEKRQHLLQDTSNLLRLDFWDAFTAGFIVTGVLSNVNWFLELIFNNSFIPAIAPGIIGAPLLVGIVGLGMWRAIFARQAYGQALPGFIGVTFGLVLGLLLGQPLTLRAILNGSGFFTSLGYTNFSSLFLSTFLAQLASIAIAGALLLALLYGLLRWLTVCFASWLEVAAGRSSPRRIYWVGLVITSIALGIVLGEFSNYATSYQEILISPAIIQSLQQRLQLPTQNPVIVDAYAIFYNLMSDPLMTVAFMCLWVYPLTTWFWRKRASIIAASNWAFLDRSSQSRLMTPTFQEPFRLRRALILGLAGGTAYFAIIYIFLKDLILHLPIFSTALLAVLLQGGIAALVAVSVRRLPVFHCLFTAFVAGCLMGVGLTVDLLPFGHHITLAVVWRAILLINNDSAYALIINEGALLALLVGLLVSALAGWLRRLWRARQRVYEPAA